MATAFLPLTTNYPEYRNRWISDDKWMEIIRNNDIDDPSKEKEEELVFSRANMIRAIAARWKHYN
jgi:sarcosine oxidase delta subunit